MKKSLPIILLSVFTLAFSALGFLGVQPVKATTEVGGITISDTDVGYRGTSITYGEQVEKEGVLTTGDGKMKFYSSLSQTLYEQLKTAKENGTIYAYKTGTLIIPAQLLEGETVIAKVNNLEIGTAQVINVETTDVWTLYDVDDDEVEDDVDDEYWAMASLYSIPRAYYTEEIVARPYIAIQETESTDLEYSYYLADKDPEPITQFYSLTTTALKKLEAGDYDNKEELKTAITNDYTTFKVTFHFSEVNKEFVESKGKVWDDVKTRTFDIKYGYVLPSYSAAAERIGLYDYATGNYRYSKGFYNKDKTAFANMWGVNFSSDDLPTDLIDYKGDMSNTHGVSTDASYYALASENAKLLTKVYGDMHLYEEVAPANLIEDFSTAQTVNAVFTYTEKVRDDLDGSIQRVYYKTYVDKNAKWHAEKTAKDAKTGQVVTENGVIEAPSHFATTPVEDSDDNITGYTVNKAYHLFHIPSEIRDRGFFEYNRTSSSAVYDMTADNYYDNNDYDYINFRVLVETTNDLDEVPLRFYYGQGNYAYQNASSIPVGEWVNIRMARGLAVERYSNYFIAAHRNQTSTERMSIEIPRDINGVKYDTEGSFTLFVDYIAYEKDMRIAVNGKDGYGLNQVDKKYFKYEVNYSKVTSTIGEEITLTSKGLDNGTINYKVFDPSGEEVTLTNGNVFTPTKLGNYTVTATCDDYVLKNTKAATEDYSYKSKQYGELVFEVVSREVGVTLKDSEDNVIENGGSIVVGNELSIEYTVAGIDDLTTGSVEYIVKNTKDDSLVAVENATFMPSAGQFSVVVKFTDSLGCVHTSSETIVEVEGVAISASMAETATIGITESLEITAIVDGEYTLKYTAKMPGIEEFVELETNVLPIGLVGEYEVYVTAYNASNFIVGETVLTTTVSAMTATDFKNTGIIATFGQEGSQKAAFEVTYADGSVEAGTYAVNISKKGDKTSIAPNTTWEPSFKGKDGVTKYGVIKTKPQITYYGSTKIDKVTANPIYLRSDIDSLTSEYSHPFYGGSDVSANDRKAAIFNASNWDYLSIPIYLPKPADATEDYTNVYLRYGVGGAIQVPYDTWYELKIDKHYLAINYYERLGLVFRYNANNAYPLFFLSAYSEDTALIEKENEQVVYIDDMRIAKYDSQFTSAKLVATDSTGATTGEIVGTTPAFTVDSTGKIVNAEGTATPLYIKPELYIGETQVEITDVVITTSKTNIPNAGLSVSDGVIEVSQFNLNSGALYTNYFFSIWVKYTDTNGIVYNKHFGFRPTATFLTA